MKKIVVAVMSTISGLVLLLSYHTSTHSDAATINPTKRRGVRTTCLTSGNGGYEPSRVCASGDVQ